MVESIDRHRGVAGAGARLLRAGKDLLGEVAELAGVVEGEAAQERPDRGRRHDPVAQHAGGGAAAKPRPRRGCSPRRPVCRGPGSAAWRRGWRRLALPGGGRRRRPRRCRAARRGWQPAATRRWPRCGGRRSRHRGGQGWVAWDGGIERVSFLAATADVRHPYSRSSQGPFRSRSRHPDSLTGGSRLRPRAAVRPGAAWFTRRCWQIASLRRPGFGPGSMRRRRDRAGLACSPVGPRPR